MSGPNCCFLTCLQVSQEAGKLVWYSHLFKNFPQFVVIHTVKGFSIINEGEVDVFLEFSCFLHDPVNVGSLISCFSAFYILCIFIFCLSSSTLLIFFIYSSVHVLIPYSLFILPPSFFFGNHKFVFCVYESVSVS